MISESNQTVPKWRSAVALAVLSFYILGTILRYNAAPAGSLLPKSVSGLLMTTMLGMALFGAFWQVFWWFSRVTADELLLRWRDGWNPIINGLLYCFGIQFLLYASLIGAFIVAALSGVNPEDFLHTVTRFGPTPDRLVSAAVLAADPLYRLILLTWGSFVVAGFREELWRAGMLAVGTKLLQPAFSHRAATVCALVFSSVLFGFAHLYQGWLAVGVTAFIGFLLGTIMLKHRSIWPAVIAHGAFDAFSFWMLSQSHSIGKN